jgi:hypothetical protein
MAMDKQRRLVELLYKKTQQGELEWSEGIAKDSYQVSLSSNTISIRPVPNREVEEVLDYEISLTNSQGKVVDTFTDVEIGKLLGEGEMRKKFYEGFAELFEMARRTASGSEQVLNEILSELDDPPF